MGLVCAPAGTVLPVDLKELVPKTEACQGGRRVGLDQLDKHSLGHTRVKVSVGGGEAETQRNNEG